MEPNIQNTQNLQSFQNGSQNIQNVQGAQNTLNQPQNKKPTNPLMVIGLVYALVVITLIGAIILVKMNQKSTNNTARSNSVASIAASLELAESVCEKYGGEIVSGEDARAGSYFTDEDFDDIKICEQYSNNPYSGGTAITSSSFSYEIGILKDDVKEEYRAGMIDSIINYEVYQDVSAYTVLENSDEFFKACNTVAGLVIFCEGIYDNVVVVMMAGNVATVDNLFAELGFPDRARLADYKPSANNSSANDEDDEEVEIEVETETDEVETATNDRREKDYNSLRVAVNSFISNSGNIDGLIERGDPSQLNANNLIGEDSEDPDGNPYEVISYTYNTWNNSGEARFPSGEGKSQVFVILHANCRGLDANGYSTPAADAGRYSFAIYGYLENGYYCRASNGAN